MSADRIVHWMGPDLTPPCPPPWARNGEMTSATPVLSDVTCPECIAVLEHA